MQNSPVAVGTERGVTELVTEADPAKKHLLNQDNRSSAVATLCLDLCESCQESDFSHKLFGQRSDFPQAWSEFKLGVSLVYCAVLPPLAVLHKFGGCAHLSTSTKCTWDNKAPVLEKLLLKLCRAATNDLSIPD